MERIKMFVITASCLFIPSVMELVCASAQDDSLKTEYRLNESVILAEVPRTRIKTNSVETKVAGSVLEHVGTAEDVLGRVSGMVRTGNGLEVLGKGVPVYYLNGRRLTDITELGRINSEQIRSVEVINSPGAEYDASVNSVVKIITKRFGEGFAADVKSSLCQYTMHKGTDPSASLNMSYRRKKMDVFEGLNLGSFRHYQQSNMAGATFREDLFHEQRGSIKAERESMDIDAKLGTDWALNESHSFGAMIQFSDNLFSRGNTMMDEDVYQNGFHEMHLISNDRLICPKKWGLVANSYYLGHVKEWELDWNIDLQIQSSTQSNRITEESSVDDRDFCTESHARNAMYATKFVASRRVWRGLLKIGTEDTFVNSRNSYMANLPFLTDANSSVHESLFSLFSDYSFDSSWGKVAAGLRYEHILMDYTDQMDPRNDLLRRQDAVFPYLSWGRTISDLTLSFNYSVKTTRPSFSQMSDRMEYRSRYVYEAGNPKLRNTVNHMVSLMMNYKWLTLGTEYLNASNKILKWACRYNDQGTILLKSQNLETPVRSYSVYLDVSPKVSFWQPRYTAGVTQQFLKLTLEDDRERDGFRKEMFNKPMFFFYASNVFSFGSDRLNPWQLESNFRFRSRMSYDNTQLMKNIWLLEFAVQKAFLEGKLVFRISASDLLNKMSEDSVTDYGSYMIYQTKSTNPQNIKLSAYYRFNSNGNLYRGRGSGADVKERLKD